MTKDEIRIEIARICSTRPFDGRLVTLRENHGGWRYIGLSGTCKALSEDGKHMVLTVENDPEKYWDIGSDVLVVLDHETAAEFESYS